MTAHPHTAPRLTTKMSRWSGLVTAGNALVLATVLLHFWTESALADTNVFSATLSYFYPQGTAVAPAVSYAYPQGTATSPAVSYHYPELLPGGALQWLNSPLASYFYPVLGPSPIGSIAPHFGSVSQDGFRVTFIGQPGQMFLMEASTNLVDWVVVTNVLLWSESFSFTQYYTTDFPQRFYRTATP